MHYRNETTVDGIRCEVMSHARPGGPWVVAFERENANIEDIERINWAQPTWGGDLSLVPVGYGFQVDAIDYNNALKIYSVRLIVQEQYWGDVTGYQAEIRDLNASLETSRQETAEAQSEAAQARQDAAAAQEEAQRAREEAEAAREELQTKDEALEAAYTEGVNASV